MALSNHDKWDSKALTNHDNAQAKSTGAQVVPSHVLDDVSHSGALLGVELGHEVIRRVRDGGAEDSGNVAGGKADSELLGLGALVLGLGDSVLVQGNDGVLKGTWRAQHELVRHCTA